MSGEDKAHARSPVCPLSWLCFGKHYTSRPPLYSKLAHRIRAHKREVDSGDQLPAAAADRSEGQRFSSDQHLRWEKASL